MYQLLKKDKEFKWEPKHEKAFQAIKDYLTSNHVIKLPTGRGTFSLYVDGSKTGLGATLLETINDQTHVVGYASRATTKTERNSFSVTELELSAIAFALKSFRHLVYSPQRLKIFTDHAAIVNIFAGKSEAATKRISSFVSYISEYNFDLYHVSGIHNAFADMLSRLPDYSNASTSMPEIVNMVEDNVESSRPPLRRSPRIAAMMAQKQLEQQSEVVRHVPKPTPSRKVKRSATKMNPPGEIPIDRTLDRVTAVPPDGPPIKQSNPEIRPPQLSLIKPSNPHSVTKLPKADMSSPIDAVNNNAFGDIINTFEPKPLYENDNLKVQFADRFHGSVPARTRDKVRELALKDYNIGISRDDLRRNQRMCPYLRDLITYLEHRILPTNKQQAKRIINQEENYCLIGDILFRIPKCLDLYDDSKLRIQLVIPETLADFIISAKHDKFMGLGHAGFLRCYLSIKRKYYIHDLANKLRDYIGKCGLCLKLKQSKKRKTDVPLQPAVGRSCTGPWQRVQIDHAWPFRSSKYSSKHIIVITDEFSQFTWLFPVDSTGAEEAFTCLNKLIRIHGIPFRGIASDRGASFTSGIMAAVSQTYGVKWSFDLSNNPSSTGLVEHKVKMMKELLKYATLGNPDLDVFESVTDCQYSLNNTSSSVTGLTPHYAFYGWDCVDPTDHNLDVDSLIPAGPIRFAEELRNEARRRNSLIKQCKVIAAQHMKHTYDRSIAALPELQKGDLVLIDSHNHPRSSKTMRSFKVRKSGPYHIHTVDKHHCVLADMNGRILPDLYPVRKLQKIDGYRDTFPADMVNVNMVDDACIESAEQPVAVDTLSSHARVTASDDSVCDLGNRIGDACNERAEHMNAEATPPIAAQVPALCDSVNKTDSDSPLPYGDDSPIVTHVDETGAIRNLDDVTDSCLNYEYNLVSLMDEISGPLRIGNRTRVRRGNLEVLCYPLGIKQAGTYIPLQSLH